MQRFVKILGILIFSGLCLGITSCTRQRSAASDPNQLIVALGSEPATLDPRFATDANGMRIVSLMFNSLVRIGADLKVEGDAARDWTFDNKNLVFSFHLYPQLQFSNGRALAKEDLLFSFEQYTSAKSPFKSALDSVKKFEVRGDNTEGFRVLLYLDSYSSKFLNSDLPMLRLLPKTEIEMHPDAFTTHPIGTGPFAFDRRDSGQIVLRARESHPVLAPKVKSLVFKIIRDEFTRFQRTFKGDIDIAQAEIPPAKLSEFEKLPQNFSVYKYPGLSMTYMLVNLKDPQLAKLELRQAIAEAIHRDEIIKYKLEGLGRLATSILTPENPYFNSSLEPVKYSPDQAARRIEALGLKGHRFTLKTSNAQSAVENAKVLAYQISKTGLKIEPQSFEWGTFYNDIRNGNFQLATMKWIGILDPDIYRLAFHRGEFPPGRNRGRYENAELDALTDGGLKITDEAARIKHYQRVQEIVFRDLAVIPLWYEEQIAVVHRRVKGYQPWRTSDFLPFIAVSKETKN